MDYEKDGARVVYKNVQQNKSAMAEKVTEEALKFLNLGINSEIAAYVFYRRASKMIGDEGLRKVIDGLAMDEKAHFLSLEDAYDKNVRSECWAPYKDILSKEGLPEIDELVQDTHKELLGKIRNLKTRTDVPQRGLPRAPFPPLAACSAHRGHS